MIQLSKEPNNLITWSHKLPLNHLEKIPLLMFINNL